MLNRLFIILIGIAFWGCSTNNVSTDTNLMEEVSTEVEEVFIPENIDESRIRFEPDKYHEELLDTILHVD